MRIFTSSLLTALTIFLIQPWLHAQGLHQTLQIEISKAATVNVGAVTNDYFQKLKRIEMPRPGISTHEDSLLMQLRERQAEIMHNKKEEMQESNGVLLEQPKKLRSFIGNLFSEGVPNDNNLAISNDGKIVSVANSTFNIYDTTGTLLKTLSLMAFSAPLGLSQDKYDPRVSYDPDADRFVAAMLNGKDDSTSFIILAFSKTNDPLGDWNLYTLPGEPLKDTTWADFPVLALTKTKLIVTINALQNNKSWQEGFRQSFIWEVDKSAGYAGKTLKTRIHSGIKYAGKSIRNLHPVQGGSALTDGPVYLLSDKNFSAATDSFFLLTLKDSITLNVQLLHSDKKYGNPPHARQPYKNYFETNDARVLCAFIENGTIQFVGNSIDFSTGRAGIFHGRVLNAASSSPFIKLNIIGDPILDLGYPGIAYAGRESFEDDALIMADHSSDTVNAGNSVYLYKNNAYSAPVRLAQGNSYVNIIVGAGERWGDYSGIQPHYNRPATVWVSGYYGYREGGGINTKYKNGTWISEVSNSSAITPQVTADKDKVLAYPSVVNPFETVRFTFDLEQEQYLEFEIVDMNGKLISRLLSDKARPGRNEFSFVTNYMRAGIYFLRIGSGGRQMFSTKFIVK